jgi:hypothetical protein
MMAEAESERVPADPGTARVFIARAGDFLADGDRPGMSAAGRQVIYWQSCITAMDAILMAAGRRVTGGEGAHALRLTEAERLLPTDHRDLFESLDGHRSLRHDASYHAGVVSSAEAKSLRSRASELLNAAAAFCSEEEAGP